MHESQDVCLKSTILGLLGGSGEASAGDTGSIPGLGRSYMQLSLCTMTPESVSRNHSCCAHMQHLLKFPPPRAHTQQERPLQSAAPTWQQERGPHSPQPEKSLRAAKTQHSQKWINKLINKLFKKYNQPYRPVVSAYPHNGDTLENHVMVYDFYADTFWECLFSKHIFILCMFPGNTSWKNGMYFLASITCAILFFKSRGWSLEKSMN